MSILGKKWVVLDKKLEELEKINLDDKSVTFHNPLLIGDMRKAVERIYAAIDANERIVVFGDYDVDGVSGTAILVHTLRRLNANVSYRLPNRNDGYGLSEVWIEELSKVNTQLLITVDCGISNAREVKKANEAGIDVIITDHHTIPEEKPESYAILHPGLEDSKYPFSDLSGSGVAFKLAVALIPEKTWMKKLVDLASLGTVADCVPLIGENRWIVKKGLEQMRKSEWEGLRILLQTAGVQDIRGHDSSIIGFRIGPRLNAAGRLDTPYYALQLLLNEGGSAATLAEKLEHMNTERQELLEKEFKEAELKLRTHQILDKKVLAVWSRSWSAGLLGLIASRLSEKYNRPAIVMEHRGEELVGSCRSPENFNMIGGLQNSSEHFISYGGHASAAGFTIGTQKLNQFLDEIEKYASDHLGEEDLDPQLFIDYEVKLSDITQDLAKQVLALEPYGERNPRPRFVMRNVNPLDLQTVGQEHRHIKFFLQGPRRSFPVIAFRFGDHFAAVQKAIFDRKPLDIAFELENNLWNGREQLQFRVVDLAIQD